MDRIKNQRTSSEDCLYLNVFAPAFLPSDGSDKFPVMVFVHGGGFAVDSAQKYGDIGICRHLVFFFASKICIYFTNPRDSEKAAKIAALGIFPIPNFCA